MIETDGRSVDSLMKEFKRVHMDVRQFYQMPAEMFVSPTGTEWSPAENMVHLVKSLSAVQKAMGYPKLMLRVMFGFSKAGSRSYEAVQNLYLDALSKGGKASGPYVPPTPPTADEAPAYQQKLIDKWTSLNADLLAVLSRWSERDLDRYRLPHPLLGKLTIREMLFFTLYHSQRHISEGGD